MSAFDACYRPRETHREECGKKSGWMGKKGEEDGRREREREGEGEISRRKSNARIFHLELDHWKNVI